MAAERIAVGDPVLAEGRVVQGEIRPASLLTRIYQTARLRRQAVVGPVTDVDPATGSAVTSFPIAWVAFVAFVVVPSILVAVYFAFLASDQYQAEARFVVRQGFQDNSSSASSLSSLLAVATSRGGASGGTSSTEDAHIVVSYIHSRSIVDDLQKSVNLREVFTRPEADFYARLKQDASAEDLLEYWNGMVKTHVENTSGIVTLEIRTFRPDDSVRVAKGVQDLSEKLVNAISNRARQDALNRAMEEVRRAQGIVIAALRDVERVQNEEGLIDPVQAATENGKILTRVLIDKLSTESQLFVAKQSLSPESPTVRQLQNRIESLTQQAANLRGQMAGTGSGPQRNLAGSLVKYEEVAVKQKMAETLYGMAESGLDRARRTAEAQSVYLTVFVPPAIPEDSSYPRRFAFPILFAIACMVLWSIAALIWASVEDHRLN